MDNAPVNTLCSIEQVVSGIWKRRFPEESIGPDSDFFLLGGDSLGMLDMLIQVSDALGTEVLPGVLFEDSTLRGFCRKIESETGSTSVIPFIEGSI